MKKLDFKLEDDENDERNFEDNSQINKTINIKNIKNDKSEKKTKYSKKDSISRLPNNNSSIPYEDKELIEFILMDLKDPQEFNKFKNMKSLSLIQQNIKSLNVN